MDDAGCDLRAKQRADARRDGGLVVDQLATEADQDRRARRPPRPRHHRPAGRHRSDGARHTCRHPPITNVTDMYVTAIPPQTERTRQDRSVQLAEKCPWRTWARPFCGPVCFNLNSARTTGAPCREKHLTHWPDQATFPTIGRILGECGTERSFYAAQQNSPRGGR